MGVAPEIGLRLVPIATLQHGPDHDGYQAGLNRWKKARVSRKREGSSEDELGISLTGGRGNIVERMEPRGIEPRFAECDSAVIPLDHGPDQALAGKVL